MYCVFHHIFGHLPRQIWFWKISTKTWASVRPPRPLLGQMPNFFRKCVLRAPLNAWSSYPPEQKLLFVLRVFPPGCSHTDQSWSWPRGARSFFFAKRIYQQRRQCHTLFTANRQEKELQIHLTRCTTFPEFGIISESGIIWTFLRGKVYLIATASSCCMSFSIDSGVSRRRMRTKRLMRGEGFSLILWSLSYDHYIITSSCHSMMIIINDDIRWED